MGTNYYLLVDVCPHCQRPAERLHIGKSSVGWCFGLHVIPDNEPPILGLDDWQKLWSTPSNIIENEYHELVEPHVMLRTITGRSHPQGLLRHSEVPDCQSLRAVRGGDTYDLIEREFS